MTSPESTILQSTWLIDKGYALANETKLVQMIKDQVIDQNALKQARLQNMSPQAAQAINLPVRRMIAAAAGAFFVFGVNPYTSTDRIPEDSIVVIDVTGPIMKYGSWYSWGTLEVSNLLVRLANSDRVKGIILNIDSPGGQVAGTADFAQTIRDVSRIKPVIAVVQDGMCASCAYWIASACREVYTTQTTCQVGSIGVYTTLTDFTAMYEASGIKKMDIYADDSFDKNQDVIQALKGDETLIKADLKFLRDTFVSAVTTNRGARLKPADKEPFTGKLYFAQAAAKLGLIEGVKPMAAVVKRMEQLIALRA